MKSTAIEWTDHTVNFWWGCDKVSPACTFCYAESWAAFAGKKLFGRPVEWGPGKPRAERLEKARAEALALNHQAQQQGVRYKVFVNSMSDWLDEEVPIRWLAFLLETLMLCPHLDWQLLTKRPENWRARVTACHATYRPGTDVEILIDAWLNFQRSPEGLWIGTTVENQEWADKRIPHLLRIPAAVRFLSCEPLLGPVDLAGMEYFTAKLGKYPFNLPKKHRSSVLAGLHWVIAGGESGRSKLVRDTRVDWVRSLRDQCAAAGVAFFFKQWGEFLPDNQNPYIGIPSSPTQATRLGKDKTGRLLDGVEHSSFPITTP